ncbi:alpha/beta hydrolase [Streptomyces sp. NPDC050560]|uniref:alpha/beta hydrolase n=1 Tax=Streptomyces sp. NPDC050560 TaxID=3365630 RepID=UPI0037BA9D6E
MLTAGLVLAMSGTATAASLHDHRLGRYTDQQLTWGDCAFTPAKGSADAQCALVTVPRDWADPGAGPDIKVSVSRVAATGERKGAILVNPGGPGGQGTSLAGDIAGLRPELSAGYDLVGMDPRGTGQEGADQGLVCHIPDSQLPQDTLLDARDRSPRSLAEHALTPKAVADTCGADDLTPYVTTWQTAHDMDLIRALLGEDKLNYLGYSYGSWLGAKYTSLFPGHAGRVVLDSSVNWQGRLQADFEDFPRIDQRQFDETYLPWVVRNLPEHIGGTVSAARATWEKVRAYYTDNGVSPDSFDAVFVGMGSELQWLLASAIFEAGAQGLAEDQGAGEPGGGAAAAAVSARLDDRAREVFGVPVAKVTPADVRGALNGRGAAAGDEPATTDVAGTRYAVACGDQPAPTADWYRHLSDRQGPRYPVYGWAYGLSEPCGYWKREQRERLPRLPLSMASHVLVVQGEFDPQTAYEQAREAVREAPGTGMLSVDDSAFHGQYALAGNTCVDAAVEGFLLGGDRPYRQTCPGTPLPGETVVYPTTGPVTPQHSHTPRLRAEGTTADTLRESLRQSVSEVNHPAP